MPKIKNYTKVTPKNLRYLFNSPRGNLYMRSSKKQGTYEVVEGFDYEELHQALTANKIELVWIEGPSLGIAVEVE